MAKLKCKKCDQEIENEQIEAKLSMADVEMEIEVNLWCPVCNTNWYAYIKASELTSMDGSAELVTE